MNESTLIDDITSLLKERGHDVEEGQGEWPVIVHAPNGDIFGVSVVAVEDFD